MSRFDDLAASHRRLAGLRDAGTLTPEEFAAAAGRLGLVADDGTAWAIGAASGRWYRLTAEGWVQAEPPSAAPPPPTGPPDAARAPRGSRILPVSLSVASVVVAGLFGAAAVRGGDPPGTITSTTLGAAATPETTAAGTSTTTATTVAPTTASPTTTIATPGQIADPASRNAEPLVWRRAIDARFRSADDVADVFPDYAAGVEALPTTVSGIDAVLLATEETVISYGLVGKGQLVELVVALPDEQTTVAVSCHLGGIGEGGGHIVEIGRDGWTITRTRDDDEVAAGEVGGELAAGAMSAVRVVCTDTTLELVENGRVLYRDTPAGGVGAGQTAALWIEPHTIGAGHPEGQVVLVQYRVYVAQPGTVNGGPGDRVYAGGLGVEVEGIRWVEEASEPTLGVWIRAHATPAALTLAAGDVSLDGAGQVATGPASAVAYPLGAEIEADGALQGELWFPAGDLGPNRITVLRVASPLDPAVSLTIELITPEA
ncbi:MAG: hypothetical protein KQH83_07745 [Actinobacteria bacterium]|nr:hypothetical protein [Actinomycetota bacterium]